MPVSLKNPETPRPKGRRVAKAEAPRKPRGAARRGRRKPLRARLQANGGLETAKAALGARVEELDTVIADLQDLLQGSHIATLYLDPELRIERFTVAAADIFPLLDGDIGRPIRDVTARIEGSGLEDELRQVLRTLVPRDRQVRLVDREGCYLMRISPYRTRTRAIEGLVVTFVDVTELERTRVRTAQLAAIVNSTSDAIFTKTLDCRLATWNAGAERMYGYSAAEAIGRKVAMLAPPELRAQCEEIVQRLRRGEEVVDLETVRLRKDGQRLHVSLTCSAIRDAEGQLVLASVIARDISARKRTEDELRQANEALRHANADLQQLAFATSHDLQEPLRQVANYAQLLARSAEQALDERSRELLGNVLGGTVRLGEQLRALQDYWSVDQHRLEPTRVDSVLVLERVIQNLRGTIEEHRAEITRDPLPALYLHETPLLQLLQNLLENALKYRRPDVPPRVHVSARRVEGAWEFSVADNGQGVPEKHRQRIFHPFRRLHGEQLPGVGMGLAICARIVGSCGGRIWVEGDGQGATFKFTIRDEERR